MSTKSIRSSEPPAVCCCTKSTIDWCTLESGCRRNQSALVNHLFAAESGCRRNKSALVNHLFAAESKCRRNQSALVNHLLFAAVPNPPSTGVLLSLDVDEINPL